MEVWCFQLPPNLFAKPACSASARQVRCSQKLAAVVLHAPSEHEVSPNARKPNSAAHCSCVGLNYVYIFLFPTNSYLSFPILGLDGAQAHLKWTSLNSESLTGRYFSLSSIIFAAHLQNVSSISTFFLCILLVPGGLMKKLLCYSDGRGYRGRYQQVLPKKSKKLMPLGEFNRHCNVCQWSSKSKCLCGTLFRNFFFFFLVCVYLSRMKMVTLTAIVEEVKRIVARITMTR